MPVGRRNRGDRGELCRGKRRREKREKRLRPREKEDSLAGSEEFTSSLLRMRRTKSMEILHACAHGRLFGRSKVKASVDVANSSV